MNVENPILQLVTWLSPWARTVQGLTPAPEATSKASPKPKSSKPTIKNKTEIGGGDIVSAFGALQKSFGTRFTDKNLGFLKINQKF